MVWIETPAVGFIHCTAKHVNLRTKCWQTSTHWSLTCRMLVAAYTRSSTHWRTACALQNDSTNALLFAIDRIRSRENTFQEMFLNRSSHRLSDSIRYQPGTG